MELFGLPKTALGAIIFYGVAAVASDCLSNVQNNTLGIFSSAGFTVSYNYTDSDSCSQYCQSINECQAWTYLKHAECTLYKRPALDTVSIPHFEYGACE